MSSTTPGAEFLDNPAKDKADEPSIDDIAAAAVRTPSSRLREKISRDGVAPESADEEKSTVSASDDDRQVKSNVENVPAASAATPTSTSEKPDRSTNYIEHQNPGAFYVSPSSEDGNRNSENSSQEVDAPTPTAPSVIVEPAELPIAATVAEDDDDAEPVMASKLDDVNVNLKSRKVRIGIVLLVLIVIGAIVGGVLGAQKSKDAVKEQCIVEDSSKLGDGTCDGGEYNTDKCQWDKGDCAVINSYPGCPISPADSAKLGDGVCDSYPYFSPECGLDAGDCADCTIPPELTDTYTPKEWSQRVGDGRCLGPLNHAGCSFDGGDCDDFNAKYPDCRLGDRSCSSFNSSFPGCVVLYPEFLSDGACDEGGYNNVRCSYDGGDCEEFNVVFNQKHPDCLGGDHSCSTFNATFPGCMVEDPDFVGDGLCDGKAYNIPECNWDNGDCDDWNDLYPDCKKEGLRCASWKEEYPDCDVDSPEFVGDGLCDGMPYNTTECPFDGSDCLEE